MEDCKGMHTEVTEKDVFSWLLDKEEEKLNVNPADDTSLDDYYANQGDWVVDEH